MVIIQLSAPRELAYNMFKTRLDNMKFKQNKKNKKH